MLQPIGDRVLVAPAAREEVTASGIVIPDSVKEKPQEGEVIAVGHGTYHGGTFVSFEELGVTVGSRIMFTKYGPTEIMIGDKEYFVLEAHDIIGIIKK